MATSDIMSILTESPPKSKVRVAVKRGTAKAPGARWNNAVHAPDEQYQLKRQAVVAEAARAFGRRGYKNVSLDAIAQALNVTKPALYYYFKNKQELIYECHELSMSVGDQALQEAIASASTGYARVTSFIRKYVVRLTDQIGAPAILHDLSAMTPSDQKNILQRRRKFDQQLRQIVEDGIVDGSIAPCDAKLAVVWFMGAVASISNWYQSSGPLRGEQIAEAFIEFLSNGICPQKPV